MRIESAAITWDRGRLTKWLSLAGKSLTLFGLVMLIIRDVGEPANGWGVVSFLLGPLFVMASYLLMIAPAPYAGGAEVRGDCVIVLHRRIRLRDLAGASVVTREIHRGAVPVIEMRTRSGDVVEIVVWDERAAHAFVEALGFGPTGRAARIDLARPTRRLLHVPLAVLTSAIGFAVAVIFNVLFHDVFRLPVGGDFALASVTVCWALAYAVLKRWFAAPVVTLGTDAIEVKQRWRTKRYRSSEIVRVSMRGRDGPLVIERRDGKDVAVTGVLVDCARLAAVAAEGERRLGRGTHPALRAASFERAGRDVAAWKAQLRSTLDASYRASGASPEDAAAVIANPHATAEQRLGAALALRIAGEPPERIRIAAESAVDPELRVAFDAIAEDEDEKLEKALRKIDAQ